VSHFDTGFHKRRRNVGFLPEDWALGGAILVLLSLAAFALWDKRRDKGDE